MEKYYVTTPIYYVNSKPHMGHAYTSVVADVIARYHRQRGRDVFFLTGTDEHGMHVSRAAQKSGKEITKFVEENTAIFKELGRKYLISNDEFIKTSDKNNHWPGASKLWKKLVESGDIYKAQYKGLYCVGHESFVTEKDLIGGKCQDHDAKPEEIEEENYFFRLSKYAVQIENLIKSGKMKIIPNFRKNEVLSLIKSGTEDVSFSRPSKDIPWGIPVPDDDTQTMYVWCDALSNYISALGYGRDEKNFEKYWPCDLHIMGKDILRFHGIIWLGMLLSAGLELPKTIYVHGMLLSGGRKMSKTLGNVIDPFSIADKYGAEVIRNYFISEVSSFDDGEFTIEHFEETYNGKLSNGLGNLTSRLSAMIEKYFTGAMSMPDESELMDVPFLKHITELSTGRIIEIKGQGIRSYIDSIADPAFHKAVENINLHEASQVIWTIFRVCDGYIQDYEPYKLAGTDLKKARAVLWNASNLLLYGAYLLVPIMPQSSAKIFSIFGVNGNDPSSWTELRISGREILFPRLYKEISYEA